MWNVDKPSCFGVCAQSLFHSQVIANLVNQSGREKVQLTRLTIHGMIITTIFVLPCSGVIWCIRETPSLAQLSSTNLCCFWLPSLLVMTQNVCYVSTHTHTHTHAHTHTHWQWSVLSCSKGKNNLQNICFFLDHVKDFIGKQKYFW